MTTTLMELIEAVAEAEANLQRAREEAADPMQVVKLAQTTRDEALARLLKATRAGV